MKRFIKRMLKPCQLEIRRISPTPSEKLRKFFLLTRPIVTQKRLIRLGGDQDGGYLLPDDLQGIRTCFSPGTSNVASFEKDLSALGIRSYMADFSVDEVPVSDERFTFLKKFIGFGDRPEYLSLEDWVGRYEDLDPGIDDEMILQMDIEGGEYDVLLESSSELLRRFRVIIIEFHSLQDIFNPKAFDLIYGCFYKLSKDFHVVHIHPNNCSGLVKCGEFEVAPVMEFTYIRKDRVGEYTYASRFPHALDRKNKKHKEEVILPRSFYAMAR